LIKSVIPIDLVLFPINIIPTLMNFTCICYFYGHGCLNASDGIIYLCYCLLSVLVQQIFFSNSVSFYTNSSLWHFLTSSTLKIPLIKSVIPIDLVLFPINIIPTLMNFTCICYFYGHGCLNASDDIIYLCYCLLFRQFLH